MISDKERGLHSMRVEVGCVFVIPLSSLTSRHYSTSMFQRTDGGEVFEEL